MLIRLVGPDVPVPLLMAFATATDHAVVRPTDVHYDEGAGVVTVPMRLASVTGPSLFRVPAWMSSLRPYPDRLQLNVSNSSV
jgi:hypothetical protein